MLTQFTKIQTRPYSLSIVWVLLTQFTKIQTRSYSLSIVYSYQFVPIGRFYLSQGNQISLFHPSWTSWPKALKACSPELIACHRHQRQWLPLPSIYWTLSSFSLMPTQTHGGASLLCLSLFVTEPITIGSSSLSISLQSTPCFLSSKQSPWPQAFPFYLWFLFLQSSIWRGNGCAWRLVLCEDWVGIFWVLFGCSNFE